MASGSHYITTLLPLIFFHSQRFQLELVILHSFAIPCSDGTAKG